jgi:hypothetical protein
MRITATYDMVHRATSMGHPVVTGGALRQASGAAISLGESGTLLPLTNAQEYLVYDPLFFYTQCVSFIYGTVPRVTLEGNMIKLKFEEPGDYTGLQPCLRILGRDSGFRADLPHRAELIRKLGSRTFSAGA